MIGYIQQLIGAVCLVVAGYMFGYRHATKRCRRVFLESLDRFFDEVIVPGMKDLIKDVIFRRDGVDGSIHRPLSCGDPKCLQCNERRVRVDGGNAGGGRHWGAYWVRVSTTGFSR